MDGEGRGWQAPGEEVSPRWAAWRRAIDLDDYDRRFADIAASGADAHGEADLLHSFAPTSVLDAGCGTGRVAIELARRGVEVVGADLDADMIDAARRKAPELRWVVADLATMRLGETFDLVAMPGNVVLFCRPGDQAAIAATLAAHVGAAGRVVAGFQLERGGYSVDAWDADCAAAGLVLRDRWSTWSRGRFDASSDYQVSVHQLRGG